MTSIPGHLRPSHRGQNVANRQQGGRVMPSLLGFSAAESDLPEFFIRQVLFLRQDFEHREKYGFHQAEAHL